MLFIGNKRSLLWSGLSLTGKIRKLFAAGQPGAWYDPSDFSTLFQDSAGTAPVTAIGQSVGKILDKSGRGNHLTLTGATLVQDSSGQHAISLNATGGGSTSIINLSDYSEAHLFVGYKVNATTPMCIAEFSASTATNAGSFGIIQGISKEGSAFATKTQFTTRSTTLVLRTDFEQAESLIHNVLSINTMGASNIDKMQVRQNDIESTELFNIVDNSQSNLGSYPLYVGSRGNSSFRLNGLIYSLVLVAGSLAYDKKVQTDRYVKSKLSAPPLPPVVVDLFITAGQSNAEGRGVAAQSPSVVNGTAWALSGSTFTTLADPFGGATTGSAWPSFANRWKSVTGRSSIWIDQATGGSALIPAAGPTNWSQGGTLYPACVSASNAAVAAINANPAYTLGNVYICWAQGEQEGLNYNGTTISDTVYEAAQNELFAALKANIPTLSKIFVSSLGKLTNGSNDAQHTLIRNAQSASVASFPYAHIAFSGAVSFVPSKMVDNVHYTQVGYNEMGEGMASFAAAIVFP